MLRGSWAMAGAMALLFAGGCATSRPEDYGRQRGDLDSLDPRDGGLQSKDLVNSTDLFAMDLLRAPELNPSRTQWTMVVMNVENKTYERGWNYDIFVERLRTKIATEGKGRVTLIENKARLNDMRNRELDRPRDDFGQGGGGAAGGRVQPDYGLYGVIMELPNRATSTYMMRFTVTDLRSGVQVWNNEYTVKVER